MVSTAAKSGIRCIVGVQGMTSPKTGATHYHVQLGLSDKGRAIKGLVVCIVGI